MLDLPPFRLRDWAALALVTAAAFLLRAGYLLEATDGGAARPIWQVQGDSSPDLMELVQHLMDEGAFAAQAPLSQNAETTAHASPGYPLLVSLVKDPRWIRWGQCGLGALTCLLLFLFARRVFGSLPIAFCAGLFTACHPYWIINAAEIADGTLASFLVASCLFLGTRASQVGGASTSLLFGVALAALALVRAAFLPFALAGLLWFLWQTRRLQQGWLCALLAFLGMGNGVAPWIVRNVKELGEPLPVVSSTWLHLYMGNNSKATGGVLDETQLRTSLPPERLKALLREKDQTRRYDGLARDTWREVAAYPGDAANRRITAGVIYLLGEPWLHDRSLARKANPTLDTDVAAAPEWLNSGAPGALAAAFLFMVLVGAWGWRRSAALRGTAGLLALATLLLPLPYLLGHAGVLVGPRLPADGIWLTYAAVALGSLWPRTSGGTANEETAKL